MLNLMEQFELGLIYINNLYKLYKNGWFWTVFNLTINMNFGLFVVILNVAFPICSTMPNMGAVRDINKIHNLIFHSPMC